MSILSITITTITSLVIWKFVKAGNTTAVIICFILYAIFSFVSL